MTDTITMMKQRILDMAIRGELVEQRSKEIIKESFDSSDETEPFSIPKNWKWVHLSEITSLHNGDRGKNYPGKKYWIDEGIPFINAGSLNGKFLTDTNMNYISEDRYALLRSGFVQKKDLIYCLRGSLGKVSINNFYERGAIASSVVIIRPKHINEEFLYYILTSKYGQELIDKVDSGTAQPNLSGKSVSKYLIPLAPTLEQKRIIKKIEEYFAIIDKIAEKREDTIRTLEKIRLTALQEAIKGNLVKQNENDEPASELIKQINEEKEQLIKEKVIKKTKKLEEISKENEPFEIPESWEWVRLGEVIDLVSGRDLTKQEYNDTNNGIPYITGASNFSQNEILVNRWTQNPKVISKKGNLLITVKGTIGEMSIQSLDEAHIARQVMAIRNVHNLDIDYIQIFLQSQIIELTRKAKSMIPGISRNDLLNFEFPLPSRNEQTRIVNKVKSINRIIKEVEERLI